MRSRPQNPPTGKQDLNNTGAATLAAVPDAEGPAAPGTDAQQRYSAIAQQIDDFRNKQHGGMLTRSTS